MRHGVFRRKIPMSDLHLEQGLEHEEAELPGPRAEFNDVQRLRPVQLHAISTPHTIP